jgi:PAS domain S-box-containing protein
VAEATRRAIEAATAVSTSTPTDSATAASETETTARPGSQASAQAELSTFLDLSAQIFCITDYSSALVWWNAAFERTLGYSPEELRSLRLDDLVHPDDRDVRRAAEAVLVENGEAGLTPVRFCTRQGEWRWLEWTTRVDFTRQRVYGAARDITERRRDEKALSESEARLRAIMKYSPSVIFVMDLEGHYLLVNDEFSRVSGIAMDAAVGMTASECWPHDSATISERERQLLEDGVSYINDESRTTVDGPRDFMVSRFLIRDEAGTPFAIGGIASDTTERRGAEKALAARDRLLDSVIGASPDMITLMDRAGKIHQISEAESALFGHRHEVFTRRDVFDFVHPDDFDDVASLFIRMVTGAVSHLHLRYRARHAEGHWVTVDSRAQAVLDGEGHFAGAVVVSRDITDKLESEQLLQTSRESAEKASKAKSDFLSRMSHELRTPLNSILGFAQLIQMDDIPGQQADAVDHILRAGRHLLDLIDEVLDIARIESGYLELTLAPVVVAEIVSEALELTNPMAARAEVVMRSLVDRRDGLIVVADRQRLMQVLLNLLSNAVKYNKPGGRVDVTCEHGPPGRLQLAVADTGRGIRAEDFDRVFVPFDRLGLEQTGIEGTGVGLALSQHLCERMGGDLSLDSVAGVGSTFVVELPESVPAAVSVTSAPGGGASGGASEGAGDGASTIDAASGEVVTSDVAREAASTSASRDQGEIGRGARAPGGVALDGVDGVDGVGALDEASTSAMGRDVGADAGGSPGPGRTFRVLLVENNLTTLDLVERVLSRRPGTEVLAAMQGGLGVDLAREHVPDMILLDLYLPDMTGDVVLDRLAEDPATADVPVAVIGAEAPPQQVRQLLGRGVIGFLAKPIDVRGLLSLVDAVRAARGT